MFWCCNEWPFTLLKTCDTVNYSTEIDEHKVIASLVHRIAQAATSTSGCLSAVNVRDQVNHALILWQHLASAQQVYFVLWFSRQRCWKSTSEFNSVAPKTKSEWNIYVLFPVPSRTDSFVLSNSRRCCLHKATVFITSHGLMATNSSGQTIGPARQTNATGIIDAVTYMVTFLWTLGMQHALVDQINSRPI
jgi:hypothetical protein